MSWYYCSMYEEQIIEQIHAQTGIPMSVIETVFDAEFNIVTKTLREEGEHVRTRLARFECQDNEEEDPGLFKSRIAIAEPSIKLSMAVNRHPLM